MKRPKVRNKTRTEMFVDALAGEELSVKEIEFKKLNGYKCNHMITYTDRDSKQVECRVCGHILTEKQVRDDMLTRR